MTWIPTNYKSNSNKSADGEYKPYMQKGKKKAGTSGFKAIKEIKALTKVKTK